MRTDPRVLANLVRRLRGYLDRITARADADARAAGLTVEVGPGGVRRYRDPRFERLSSCHARTPYAEVPTRDSGDAGVWSAPTLTTSAGWSR